LVEELQELHDYEDSFVATVAHQLMSPLTSIIGHIELLEEAPDQPGQAGPDMPAPT
jgi:signal transduction histidine kinase